MRQQIVSGFPVAVGGHKAKDRTVVSTTTGVGGTVGRKGDVDESVASDDSGYRKRPWFSVSSPQVSRSGSLTLQASGATGVEARLMLKEVDDLCSARGEKSRDSGRLSCFAVSIFGLALSSPGKTSQRAILDLPRDSAEFGPSPDC